MTLFTNQLNKLCVHLIIRKQKVLQINAFIVEIKRSIIDIYKRAKETNGLLLLYDYKTQRFLNLCASAALRTNDITLIESIKNTLLELFDQKVPFYINNIDLLRPDKRSLVEPILEAINNRGYSIDDYIDRKTVFLSYNHHQMEIADLIDDNLEALGFRVIRDIKNLSMYDSIHDFMESSKNYDYSVALISKEFLSSILL